MHWSFSREKNPIYKKQICIANLRHYDIHLATQFPQSGDELIGIAMNADPRAVDKHFRCPTKSR